MSIRSYRDQGTRDIARSENTKEARRSLPPTLHHAARRRLAFLSSVDSLSVIKARAGLGLHALKQDRLGEYAIKINDQYRICFLWNGKDAEMVQITDYH